MSPRFSDRGSGPVSVADFFEAGKERLELEVVAGASGMQTLIDEPAVNRPGLALTGFFQYFAYRRIQTFGHAEHAYLAAMETEIMRNRLRAVFTHHIPCVVVTRKRKVLEEIAMFGEELDVPVMRCPMITGEFVNVATILMERLQAPKTTMHGTMVEIMGIGVLIMGKAGVGKSETALSLIKKGHSLVSDDVTAMRLDSSGVVVASALHTTRYHMALRGLGIVHIPSLFGVASVRGQKKLDLIVELFRVDSSAENVHNEEEVEMVEVLGASVPKVRVPVVPGRDIAGLIEVAALDQTLKNLGHDAAKELDEKLIAIMSEGVSTRE